ncbi:MAG: hypothetical protein N2596_06685 [Syntrophorhabdaceae bacterium]|nr:hypothetical protein [Syntrophorhabdaceae bacterium]
MIGKSIIVMALYTFLFVFCTFAFASEHIIIYAASERLTEINQLKRYLEKNKIKVGIYNRTDRLDKHMENLNKINNSGASFLIVLNFEIDEREDFFIAVPDTKDLPSKPTGRFNFIEDLPHIYEKASRELATSIASSFNAKIKTLPLFYAVGLNMPCVFVSITTKKDFINNAFEKFYSGLKNYFTRGEKDER